MGAAIAAISGVAESAEKIILIAGGVAKGADFSLLLPVLRKHLRALVLIGEAADQLQALCADSLPIIRAATMDAAVEEAAAIAESGDAVLLSPACASFDMFKNYQHRGDVFNQAVRVRLAGGRN